MSIQIYTKVSDTLPWKNRNILQVNNTHTPIIIIINNSSCFSLLFVHACQQPDGLVPLSTGELFTHTHYHFHSHLRVLGDQAKGGGGGREGDMYYRESC